MPDKPDRLCQCQSPFGVWHPEPEYRCNARCAPDDNKYCDGCSRHCKPYEAEAKAKAEKALSLA